MRSGMTEAFGLGIIVTMSGYWGLSALCVGLGAQTSEVDVSARAYESREGAEIDVAARHDGHDAAMPALCHRRRQRRCNRARGRPFGNHVQALRGHAHGRGGV